MRRSRRRAERAVGWVAAAGLAAVGLGTPAGAWEHNAVLWNDASSPIPVELFDAPVGELSVEELEGVVQRSLDTWNAVPCASVALRYAGRTDHTLGVDDRQTLQWIDDPEQWVYGSMAAGANIAFVYDPPETPEHEDPKVDIAFNAVNFQWRIGGDGPRNVQILDPQSVMTHELGHFLGLAHTGTSNAATMAPAYVPDTSQRTLSLDDQQGLCAKYWVDADGCASDAECADGAACVTWTRDDGSDARLCAEHHGRWGDFCAGDDLNCEGLCLFTRNDLSEGACTTRCEDDLDCPCGWSCRNIQSPDNPLLVCRSAPADDPDINCPQEPDAGLPDADGAEDAALPSPDADTLDGGGATPDAAPDTPDAPDAPPAATSPPDDGCGCAAPSSTRPPLAGAATLGVAALLLSLLAWTRRS